MAKKKIDWETVAREALFAVRVMDQHYTGYLAKSNPGFMGKLCLQHYDLWNRALMAQTYVLNTYKVIKSKTPKVLKGV